MTRTGFLAAAKYPWRPVPLLIQSPEWVKRAVGIFLKSIAGFREVAHEKGWKIPSVDMIDLENDRMLRVRYGDTATLCTHLITIYNAGGEMEVTCGGPDNYGTVWMKFYETEAMNKLSTIDATSTTSAGNTTDATEKTNATTQRKLRYLIWVVVNENINAAGQLDVGLSPIATGKKATGKKATGKKAKR